MFFSNTCNGGFNMAEKIIAIIALLVAIASFFYTWKTNTKKYELSENLRNEILSWYDRCINVLVSLRKHIEVEQIDNENFIELNTSLYSLAEIGRFFFPNYNRNKGKGKNNPEAYKGNRPLLVDLLVESHKITSRKKDELLAKRDYYISELKLYQKGFTSELFLLMKPDLYIERHMKNTALILLHQKTFSESEYAPQNRKNINATIA